MFTITLTNRNGRTLRQYNGVDLPGDIDKAIEMIWLGMSAACSVGRITVDDETTGEQIADRVFMAAK